jgi:hypothetical protein
MISLRGYLLIQILQSILEAGMVITASAPLSVGRTHDLDLSSSSGVTNMLVYTSAANPMCAPKTPAF